MTAVEEAEDVLTVAAATSDPETVAAGTALETDFVIVDKGAENVYKSAVSADCYQVIRRCKVRTASV